MTRRNRAKKFRIQGDQRFMDTFTKKTYRVILLFDEHVDVEDEGTGLVETVHRSWFRNKQSIECLSEYMGMW